MKINYFDEASREVISANEEMFSFFWKMMFEALRKIRRHTFIKKNGR